MATKKNPGAFDCYGSMPDDEPHFILRATGKKSPGMVRIWAYLTAGDYKMAQRQLELLQKLEQHEKAELSKKHGPGNHFNGPKVLEAFERAQAMEAYAGKGGDEVPVQKVEPAEKFDDSSNPMKAAERKAEQDLKEGFDDQMGKDKTTGAVNSVF